MKIGLDAHSERKGPFSFTHSAFWANSENLLSLFWAFSLHPTPSGIRLQLTGETSATISTKGDTR